MFFYWITRLIWKIFYVNLRKHPISINHETKTEINKTYIKNDLVLVQLVFSFFISFKPKLRQSSARKDLQGGN